MFRVLVVDDERSMLESMEAILSMEYEVRTCNSAAEALKLLNEENFHVVILDWQMPGMDGLTFLKRIFDLNLPVTTILVSGHGAALRDAIPLEMKKRAIVMEKPVDPAKLINQVNLFGVVAKLKQKAAQRK